MYSNEREYVAKFCSLLQIKTSFIGSVTGFSMIKRLELKARNVHALDLLFTFLAMTRSHNRGRRP